MKRTIKIFLLTMIVTSLCCANVFADSVAKGLSSIPGKYTEYVAEAIEKSEFTEEQIDTDKIFIVENTSYINLKKNLEPIMFWVALPIKDSSDISYAGFEKEGYVKAFTNFVSLDGMIPPYEGKLDKYIEDNKLSEPTEIKNMWISERVHLFAYNVKCGNTEYIIPHKFADFSIFNVTEDESCVLEIGKAYTIDEFVSICEKEDELYAAYKAEERKKDNRPIVSVDDNGDEVVKVGGTSLDDVKKDILKNVELMEEDSYVEIIIDSDNENFESEHRYTSSSSKKELTKFVEELFEELYLQTTSGTVTSVDGDSHCNIKIRYKENSKWVLHNTAIHISDTSVKLATQNYGDIMFKVKNSDNILDFLSDYAKNGFDSFNNKVNDANAPEQRGTLEGLTKTDVIEFEYKLPANADNSIAKEVASPGKTITGIFEKYKENKYKSTYILTLSGNLGKISLYNQNQSSLSGDDEYFSNNIPISFSDTFRYENGNLVEYKNGKNATYYDFKMVFKDNDISNVYFDNTQCAKLKYTQLTEDTKLSDEYVEKDKEVIIREAKECADILYDLGLFKGTDKGYELEKGVTREESATILVRLLGEEENVNADDFDEVFVDVDKDRWSYAYVMYCYENNITKGTGKDTFSPDVQIDASQFVALIMRLLGYTEVNPDTALQKSVEYKLLPEAKIEELTQKKVFTRDDMVQIVYRSLKTQMNDETVFAEYLSDKGVLTSDKLEYIK